MWLIDPVEDYDIFDAPTQPYAFLSGLQSLLKPQKCQARVRPVRRLAFSWTLLTPTIDELKYPSEVYDTLSLFEKMAQAGVKEIHIVVEDNEAADKQDIVFLRAQESPQEYLKSGKDWITNYLELLYIEAGDGWNFAVEKLRKSFEERDHNDMGSDKIIIPSFKFVDAISASIGRVPKKEGKVLVKSGRPIAVFLDAETFLGALIVFEKNA